jgi:hypothetical protein
MQGIAWRRSMARMGFPLRRLRLAAALSAGLAVAACGGGIYLEFDDDDLDPVVDLAASATSAQGGATVRLVAAAADESGIDRVNFYRFDGNTAVRLGSDSNPPYDWQFEVPDDGRTSVIVFARAYDNFDNSQDSALVTITITP